MKPLQKLTVEYMNRNNLTDRGLASELTDALEDYPYPGGSFTGTAIMYWRTTGEPLPTRSVAQLQHIAEHAKTPELQEFAAGVLEIMAQSGDRSTPLVDLSPG